MVSTRKTALAAAGALALFALQAQASLVGDKMFVGFYTGDIDTLSSLLERPIPIKVRHDRQDEVSIGCCIHINVNAEVIHIRFSPATQQAFGNIGTFNGIKFTSVEWQDKAPGSPWLRYTLSTNMADECLGVGEPIQRVIAVRGMVALDLRCMVFNADSYIDLMAVPSVPWAPPQGNSD